MPESLIEHTIGPDIFPSTLAPRSYAQTANDEARVRKQLAVYGPLSKKTWHDKRPWLPRQHFYDFIEMLPAEFADDWKDLYTLVLNSFMRFGGIRVLDIEETTLRNIITFGGGDKAFFEEDRWLLIDFCRMVISVYQKFR